MSWFMGHWSHPQNLWLLLLILPLGLFLFFGITRRRRALGTLVDNQLVPAMTGNYRPGLDFIRALLLIAACSFLVLALAGPRWGSRLMEVNRRGVDVFFLLDTSASMEAEDLKPSRLQAAQAELDSLIDELSENRLGLIVFSGQAVVQCPLTLDSGAVKMALYYQRPDALPIPGTSLGKAIRMAVADFPAADDSGKAIILLTDGEDHGGDVAEAAREAKAAGVVIFPIGVGTDAGAPIPSRDQSGAAAGFKTDSTGKTVMSRLNEGPLKELARTTGGQYVRLTYREGEVETIRKAINGLEKGELGAQAGEQMIARFTWPLGIALVLLLFELVLGMPLRFNRRRDTALSALVVLIIITSLPAQASPWSLVRKGNSLYNHKDYPAAAESYRQAQVEEPDSGIAGYDLGNALYRQGKYAEALAEFQAAAQRDPAIAARALYNSGNACFQMQRYQEAFNHYKASLLLNPDDRDAKANLELARRKMQEQRRQGEQQQKPGQEGQAGQPDQPDRQEGQPQKPGQEGQPAQPDQPDRQGATSGKPTDRPEEEGRVVEGMSEADVERLLRMIHQEEVRAYTNQQGVQRRRVRVDKDW